MRGFVGADFLSFMGIIVTISVATAINLQIEMNKMEERAGFTVFTESRRAVRGSTYALLWSLLLAVIVAVTKPIMNNGEIAAALFNSLALLIVLFAGVVLADIVAAAFGLSALLKDGSKDED